MTTPPKSISVYAIVTAVLIALAIVGWLAVLATGEAQLRRAHASPPIDGVTLGVLVVLLLLADLIFAIVCVAHASVPRWLGIVVFAIIVIPITNAWVTIPGPISMVAGVVSWLAMGLTAGLRRTDKPARSLRG